MDFNKLKEEALKEGIKEIEMYTSISKGTSISTFNNKVDSVNISDKNVVCVRGVYNNQIASCYTEKNNDSEIPNIINTIKDNASIILKKEPFFIYEGDKTYPTCLEEPTDFNNYDADYKTKLLLKMNELSTKNEFVTSTEASYEEVVSRIEIKNSNGLNLVKNTSYADIFFETVATKDDETKTGYGLKVFHKMSELDLGAMVKEALDNTLPCLGAKSIKSGSYNVVLKNSVVDNLLSGFASIFSAKSVLRKVSFLSDKLNQKVFGDNITIYDDPLNDLAWEKDTFDDEGVASYKKAIIKNGVLETYLHNLSTSKMMNMKNTANGYKDGVASSVNVSHSCLVIEPGKKTLAELFSEMNDGIYITNITGLHAGLNPISGSFNLQSSGFLIENGKISKPITLIIISGTFTSLMNSVKNIGNDLYTYGKCICPSLLVSNMNISGE